MLEVCSERPEALNFSDFITLTRSLNDLLPKVYDASVSGNSVPDLVVLDVSHNYTFQLQRKTSDFVLAWSEYNAADVFSSHASRVWKDLADPTVLAPEDRIVDNIVWDTVVEHATVQYNLASLTIMSPVSEAVLGQAIKAYCLAAVCLNGSHEKLFSWLSNLLLDIEELDDDILGPAVVQVIAILAIRFSDTISLSVQQVKDIINKGPRGVDDDCASLASLAADHLVGILENTSGKDALVSTMYGISSALGPHANELSFTQRPVDNASAISLVTDTSSGHRAARNAIEAISVLGTRCKDVQIAALALSILLQKFERVDESLQSQIVTELAAVAFHCSGKDVLRLSTFYTKVESVDNTTDMALAIQCARDEISSYLVSSSSESYIPYLESLLRAGIQRAPKSSYNQNMFSILVPLATLLRDKSSWSDASADLLQLFHNFWFHLVISGYTVDSHRVSHAKTALMDIARGSPSLALETLTDSFESDLESYPILKQSHEHEETKRLQASLSRFLPGDSTRNLPYSKAIYLNAVALLESLRSQAGIASGSLAYYRQPTLSQSDVSASIAAISLANARLFLQVVGANERVRLDQQLRDLLVGCCDQVAAVRQQATSIIDLIVNSLPSAFCSIVAITTLLETITLLGLACYEEYTEKYSPSYEFKSNRADITIIVSDSFADRNANLVAAERHARIWINKAMLDSDSDARTLLTTYITTAEDHVSGNATDRGKLLAVELAMKSSSRDQPADQVSVRDSADAFLGELTLRHLQMTSDLQDDSRNGHSVTTTSLLERSTKRRFIPFSDLREKLCSYVARILKSETKQSRLLRQLVEIPFNVFTIAAIRLATSLWARVVTEKPEYQADLLSEIARCWTKTAADMRGFFSTLLNNQHPFSLVMEYAPTDKEAIEKEGKVARAAFEPHLNIIRFLSSRLAAPQSATIEGHQVLLSIVGNTLEKMRLGQCSNHTFSRELSLRLVVLGLRLKHMMKSMAMGALEHRFATLLYDAALSLFSSSPRWAFGSDTGQLRINRQLCITILELMKNDIVRTEIVGKTQLTGCLLESEIYRIDLWLQPITMSKVNPIDSAKIEKLLPAAWQSSPAVCLSLAQRYASSTLQQAIRLMILKRPWEVLSLPIAAEMVLGTSLPSDAKQIMQYMLYWAPVVPISAITYFLPSFKSNPFVLQYAMRSLESHAVNVTFFYVPQIVQVLRHDSLGYVRRFIIETAKLSQLFAHQIIWNFDANAYKDEDATIPDTIKPVLDEIKTLMMQNLSGSDKEFYETEFRFFGEVTSISGKLKPYIKKTKPEKKAKIDEEMALIKVEKGVYLPSNPDGEVIDIDRRSGRPLQSHAKAPFMATFLIRKTRDAAPAIDSELGSSKEKKSDVYEKRQSAIFKVGDDCRQDMLALQLISTFRCIFNSVGLDLYVFPYRVTATAPGCGVIDVLPNSISRDMLGREAVNGLYDYFITTFGKPESVGFQRARMNFIKSLAAYSVITYLLQFKDRHNGNIMYDNQGHILHIDFGFCFDIAPGGGYFEVAPFKLTTEMIAVLGGSTETQSYKTFQELCIKAFLVARQYSEEIIHLVTLMLDSGLPCFKGQTTINNLRDRFHLKLTEQQAAQEMLHLISQSHQNRRTVVYDVFQKAVSSRFTSKLTYRPTAFHTDTCQMFHHAAMYQYFTNPHYHSPPAILCLTRPTSSSMCGFYITESFP